MAAAVLVFTFSLILVSLSLCSTSSPSNNIAYLHQESGYHFRAYPSYFDDKYSFKNFNKIRRSLAASVETTNVLDFGAKGDGTTDDTKAFQKAWAEACSSTADHVNFVVPQNKNYLVKQIRFSGPCKSGITIGGSIIAWNDRSDYSKDLRQWIVFYGVEDLEVSGGGVINGNGKIWWQNSCKTNKAKPCTVAPTALRFFGCRNLVVKSLKIENAQQMHVSFEKCRNVQVSNLLITSPETSPNTDGIHVTDTQNIQISTCTIATGDDCISIVSGSQMVRATGIICGPGHGISIGSLGAGNSEAHVSDIVIDGAKLSGTANGVRIKTWQGGSGSVSNIKFENIEMENVKNPIIIDQHYCDQDKPCREQASAVEVSNIVYENIRGTSASKVAIAFECSKSRPCQGILMQNVNLERTSNTTEYSQAVCNNVNFFNSPPFSPTCPN
ncbi:Pectin lyase-like superfamily protein [Perilla frutescens var. hirtella]|nr:Pectin lyase-like superfamily protein [Perilla frutescens var. frutescens]KAH6793873.1 Pectin lyase-like superfamily protein [Perilla frutescens var. hirtella]